MSKSITTATTRNTTTSTTTTTKSFIPANYDENNKRDAAYIWSSLFAGAGSGALSSIVCAPLDLLRTRMQVWGDLKNNNSKEGALYFLRSVLQQDGWRGCFRGLGATLATVPLFWGIYFPLYDDFKRSLDGTMNPSLVHCTSAIAAGGVADVLCNPMFVVRTRLQTEALHTMGTNNNKQPSGVLHTMRVLYREGGVAVFWRGLAASLMGLSHVAVQFPAYEWLKKQARYHRSDHRETALDLLLSSGLAKATASLTTYPHEVVRSRMMDSRQASGLVTTIQRIWTQEGIAGFYGGLQVSLIRVIPNCCITFLSYELLLRFAKDQIHQHRRIRGL